MTRKQLDLPSTTAQSCRGAVRGVPCQWRCHPSSCSSHGKYSTALQPANEHGTPRSWLRGPGCRGYGKPVWRHGGQEEHRWRDTELDVSLQMESRGMHSRENEDIGYFCACVSRHSARSSCCLSHGYSTGNLSCRLRSPCWSISEANRQKQSMQELYSATLQRSARSHNEQESTAVHISTLSLAKAVGCCRKQDRQGIRPSQHGLMKGRSRFTSTISSVDEGKPVDAISTWTLIKPSILSPTTSS